MDPRLTLISGPLPLALGGPCRNTMCRGFHWAKNHGKLSAAHCSFFVGVHRRAGTKEGSSARHNLPAQRATLLERA